MLRSLYRFSVQLHPRRFRQRFSSEMLSIFDEAASTSEKFKLLMDALQSVACQWTLRPEFWSNASSAQQPTSDGVPSFQTIAAFRPGIASLIHGLVLSTLVFGATCFAIRYSWIHLLHVHIPEVQFESSRETVDTSQPTQHDVPANDAARPLASGSESEIDVTRLAKSQSTIHRAAPTTTIGRRGNQSDSSQDRVVRKNPVQQGMAMPLTRTSGPRGRTGPHPDVSPVTNSSATACLEACRPDLSKLDAAKRKRIIDGAIANLKQHYVDPVAAQQMADALLAHEKGGDDDPATDGDSFARMLTRQLREVRPDLHLDVIYSQLPIPLHLAVPTREGITDYQRTMQRENCTVEKVEILPHNIGYLRLNSFPDLSICQSTAATAMASLNRADAIIFDLRNNHGGEPEMVAFIAAYLFDHPEYWYNPREATTVKSWTRSPVPGNKLADKPAYILTSASTASGAEQFCYDLKMLRRATLVGETTSGAAHAGVFHRIDEHFGIGIPEVRPINPYSETDWAEIGVEPDVRVKASDALVTAEKLANQQLQKK